MTIEQNIFSNGHTPEIAIGKHNVGSGVLAESDRVTREKIDTIYGARLGHLPNAAPGGIHVALIETSNQSSATREHLKYLSELYGVKIDQMSSEQINKLNGNKLVVPYINTHDVDTVNGPDTTIWGLPREVVNALKNKATAHSEMRELQTPGIEPVDFIITNTDNLVGDTLPFLMGIYSQYEQHGFADTYPTGVVIRPEGCDGGYGNAVVVQTTSGYAYTPDGEPERTIYFDGWVSALSAAKNHVKNSSRDESPEVVVSRLIDVEDSPGMTVLMIDGEPHSLGWNGQLMPVGGKACIGTSSFNPKSDISQQVKFEHEEESAEALATHVHAVAQRLGISLKRTRGLVNVDLMIPGQKERDFLYASGRNPRMIPTAEFNPRWTNGSDAAAAVVWSTRRSHTAREYMHTVQNGLLAVDKEKVPLKNNSQRYEIALRVNEQLTEEGSGVILRMPGEDTIGVIYHGNIEYARKEFLANI